MHGSFKHSCSNYANTRSEVSAHVRERGKDTTRYYLTQNCVSVKQVWRKNLSQLKREFDSNLDQYWQTPWWHQFFIHLRHVHCRQVIPFPRWPPKQAITMSAVALAASTLLSALGGSIRVLTTSRIRVRQSSTAEKGQQGVWTATVMKSPHWCLQTYAEERTCTPNSQSPSVYDGELQRFCSASHRVSTRAGKVEYRGSSLSAGSTTRVVAPV